MSENHPFIYSIKRHGTTLASCDSEPVQTPGCVQSHGVLFAVRPSDLTIVQVSESCVAHVGLPPREILGRSVGSILGEDSAARLSDLLRGDTLERNPTFIASISPGGDHQVFDLTAHTIDGVLLVEMERTERAAGGEQDYYHLLRRTINRLRAAGSTRELFAIALAEIRQITGLDRVMVYRFHPDDTGEVVGEEKREDLPSWLGLRYPPHDIPKPAREIFKKIWIRPVPDARAELAEMVPLAHPDTGRPWR